MEQPLRTLFALDLWEGSAVRFRPLVFLVVFAAGFIVVLATSLLLFTPNVPLQWLATGLIAALVSFKWEKAES
jgi:formate/nitrite transporter FocA (FNT family)